MFNHGFQDSHRRLYLSISEGPTLSRFILVPLILVSMRFSITSIKGGVGKSTASVLLSLELNRLNKGVVLVDMDLPGYTSFLARLDGPGLLSSIVDGLNREKYFKDEGNTRIVKLAGDGPRMKIDVEKIRKDERLFTRFQEAYFKALSFPHEYTIIDNYPLSSPTDEEIALEREIYSLRHKDRCYDIKVTDSNEFDINQTLEYAIYQKSRDSCETLALVINMIPSPSRKRTLENNMNTLLSKIDAKVGILVPFIEELFQYSGPIRDIPRLPQFARLAEMIVSGDVDKEREKSVISY